MTRTCIAARISAKLSKHALVESCRQVFPKRAPSGEVDVPMRQPSRPVFRSVGVKEPLEAASRVYRVVGGKPLPLK